MNERLMTPEEALSRLQNLCSRQEKCSGDVFEKLRQWKIAEGEREKIVERLKKDKFIDDVRFAGFFVRDKQRINKWGREKIRFALKRKNLNKDIIDEALSNLPAEGFTDSLNELLVQKLKTLGRYDAYGQKSRLIRYGLQRGFGYEDVIRAVEGMIKM